MAYIGEGNNKLICFLIHLEKTDPKRYAAIRSKAYDYMRDHASDVMYMNSNITTSEAIDIIKLAYAVVKALIRLFSSEKKTRDEEIAEFLSKYTRMELCESVRRVDCMTSKEKVEHLVKYDE